MDSSIGDVSRREFLKKTSMASAMMLAGGASLQAQACASGVVLSRKYAEMRLTNLAGAGEALRELHRL
jgi:hypothetical protein